MLSLRQEQQGRQAQQDLLQQQGPHQNSQQVVHEQQFQQQMQQSPSEQQRGQQQQPAVVERFTWDSVTIKVLDDIRTRHGMGNTMAVRSHAVRTLSIICDIKPNDNDIRTMIKLLIAAKKREDNMLGLSSAIARRGNDEEDDEGQHVAATALETLLPQAVAFANLQTQATQQVIDVSDVPTADQQELLADDMTYWHKLFWKWRIALFAKFYKFCAKFPAAHNYRSIGSPHGARKLVWSDSRGGGLHDLRMLTELNKHMKTVRALAEDQVICS